MVGERLGGFALAGRGGGHGRVELAAVEQAAAQDGLEEDFDRGWSGVRHNGAIVFQPQRAAVS